MGFNLFSPNSWGQAFGSGGNQPPGAPAQNPNAFQYGGQAGGAQAAQAGYATQQQQAQNAKAAQVSNPYAGANRQTTQGVQSGMQGLQGYYSGQMNMGVNSPQNLGTAELNKATAEGIAAQQAQAASAQGSLGSALANRNAQQQGVASQNAANQQAAIDTIQQQQQAAQGAAGLYGTQAQTALGQSAQDIQNSQYQAGLQQQQNALNAQTGLGYASLGANVAQQQLQAQMAGQQYNLGAAGTNTQQAEFNAGQSQNLFGTLLGAAGGAASMADADLEEPGRGGERGPAGFTLREESAGPGHRGFILAIDHQSGEPMALATRSLSHSELAQAMAPHGAGPLDSPHRQRTVVHDMGLGDAGDMSAGAGLSGSTAPAGDLAAAQMGQQLAVPGQAPHPMMGGGGNPLLQGAAAGGQFSPLQQQKMAAGFGGGAPGLQRNPGAVATGAAEGLKWGQNNTLMAQLPALPMQYGMRAADMDLGAGSGIGGTPPPMPPARRRFADAPGNLGEAMMPALASQRSIPQMQFEPGAPAPGDLAALAAANEASTAGLPTKRDFEWKYGPTSETAKREQAAAHVDPSTLARPPAQAGAAGQGAPALPAAAGAGGPAKTSWVENAPPGTVKALQAAQGAEVAGQAESVQAARAAIAAETAGHQATERAVHEDAAQRAAMEVEQQRKVGILEMQRSEFAEQRRRAEDNYGWHPSTAQRIRFGIASFLGAMGSGLNHALPNYAAQNINATIERDLDRQKQIIESKKGNVADVDSALAAAYRKTGDMRQALALAHSDKLAEAAEHTLAMSGASKDAAVQAQGKTLVAELQQKHIEALRPYFAKVTTGGAGAGGVTREKVLARAMKLRDEHPELGTEDAQRQALAEFGVGPQQGALPAKGGGGKVNPNAAALESSLSSIPKGAGLDIWDRLMPGWGAMHSNEKLAERQALVQAARAELKAQGGREPPAGAEGDAAALETALGASPNEEAVKAFKRRAAKLAADTAAIRPSGGGEAEAAP